MIKLNKIFILFTIFSYVFAYIEGGSLPYAIFYSLLISFFISFLIIYQGNKMVNIKLKLDKATFERNENAEITEIINNKGLFPLPYIYYININMKELDHNYNGYSLNLNLDESKWIKSSVKLIKRGKFNIGNVSIEIRDFLNILKFKKHIKSNKIIYVYPKIYDIKGMESGGKDIYRENFSHDFRNIDIHKYKDIKKYQLGESLKKVHWKVTAKKGELYTKNNDNVSVNDVILILDMNVKNNYIDVSKDLEEELVSYFLSVVKYFIKLGIRTHIFINNEKEEDYILRDYEDFNFLLDYFLENKSRGTKNIIDFLSMIKELYQDITWSGVFTLQTDIAFTEGIKKFSKINLFYLEESTTLLYIKELENIAKCYDSRSLLIRE